MGNNRKCYRLGDIATFSYGQLPKKELIGTGEYVVFSGYKYSDPYPEKNVFTGDLIVVARGVGGTGDVKLVNQDSFLTNLSIKIVLNNSIVRNEFIYYLFSINNLRYLDSGSAQSQITISDLANVEVTVPDVVTQDSIIYYLKTLDQKIRINNEINQTVEQMAKTLFKSWFVDFDPVIDNALDAGNEIPESLQARADRRQKVRASQDFQPLPAEVRVLFPAEFENSELGWVPKGWEVQTFSEISYILNGCAFKSEDYVKEGNFVLRTKNFTKNQVERYTDDVFLPDSFLDSHSQHLCQPYDYHLVMVGASVGNCAIIYPHQLPAFRNQNMWCFRTKKPDLISQSFIKYLLDFVVTKSLGLASGSAREFFRKGDFGDQLVCLGTSEIQIIFKNICESYLTKMGMLCAESKSLIQLRDTLLPKLISGELRLDDLPDEIVTAANE